MDASNPKENRTDGKPARRQGRQVQGLPVRSRHEMDAFVRAYQDRVYNVVYRLCGNREDAMELTQETFLRAIESGREFRGQADVFTWLYRIATNLAISHYRKFGKRRPLSLDDPFNSPDEESGRGPRLASPRAGPLDAAMASETQQRIMEALDHLDPDHRAVVILRDIEDLDYAEISEIVGVPVGTVKSRIHRGRMILREKLKDLIAPPTGHLGGP